MMVGPPQLQVRTAARHRPSDGIVVVAVVAALRAPRHLQTTRIGSIPLRPQQAYAGPAWFLSGLPMISASRPRALGRACEKSGIF
jgi:hypothetical protein